MSGKFVRASKFRHVYGQPVKRELCYDNVRMTKNAWDSNAVKVNPNYLSVNWDSSGGGAFAVIPLNEVGKLPDKIPLFRGHTAAVLDTDWNPFDDSVVASASDDGRIGIWKVPEGFTTKLNEGDDIESVKDVEPVKFLSGHSKKVGHIMYHPVAKDVLATSSGDYSIKIWNVETGKAIYTLQHPDIITSFAFSYDGSQLATTCRDKKIRVWDIRAESVVSEGQGHAGAKSSRVVWLGQTNRLATTGFSRMSDRQVGIWDASNIAGGPIGDFVVLDSSAGICMPFFDEGTNCLYLAGKGDGNIRYFEYSNDELFPLSEYQTVDPQRGMGMLPRRGLKVHEHEVVRLYKMVNSSMVEPVSFYVPRRAESFQSDIYPDAKASEPALTAEEWFSGKTSLPKVISLEAKFEGKDPEAFVAEPKAVAEPSPSKPESTPEPPKQTESVKSEPKEDKAVDEPKTSQQPAALPKQDVEGMFASKGVSEFLSKSADADDKEEEESNDKDEDDSEWNEKPEPARPAIAVAKAETPVAAAESKDPVTKDVELVAAEPEKAVESKSKEPEQDKAPVTNGQSKSLEQLVEELSKTVATLQDELDASTARIAKLEDEVTALKSN